MARSMSRNVLIIVFLCVAILFLSGIILPKIFSKNYLELRSELLTRSEDLKLNYKRKSNLTSITLEDSGNSSLVENTTLWKNFSAKLLKDIKHEEKVRRRKKRQAYSKSKEQFFAWNFNLNVTRYENGTPTTPNEKKHSEQNKSNNYLGMAVYVEGNGPKRSYRELESAWSSAGAFIRSLFGIGIESLPPNLDNHKNKAVFAISGSLQTNPYLETTQSSGIEMFNNEGSGDGSQNLSGREGRFLFNFLGFGGKSFDKATEFSKNEEIATTADSTLILDKTQTDNFRNDVTLLNGVSKKPEMVAESNEKVIFPSKSLVLNANRSLTSNITEISIFNSSESSDKDNVPTIFESNEVPDADGCFDCEIESFKVSIPIKSKPDILDTTIKSNAVFTEEELEKYCMDLVNKLEESQRFLSEISGSDLQDGNFEKGNQPSSVRGPEMFDLFSLLSALQQNQMNSSSGIVEDSLLVDESISSSTDKPKIHVNRQSRFFNLNMFGFGSGRSAFEETNDLTLDDPDSDDDKIENLPSILDCENYFRQKQNIKMFPKPNLMDIIIDPSIQLTDFTNGSISLKLKEQQLQFLTDSLKASLNKSIENSVNSENELQNPSSIKSDTLSERLSESEMNPEIQTNVEEITTVVSEFNLSNSDLVGNAFSTEVQNVTEMQRDGRFFGFLGFGSGNGGSEDTISTERDGRFFIGSFLGSGERLLETLGAINEANVQIKETEDSLQNTFSADSRIVDSETDTLSDFTAPASGQERFWSLLGFSGNGDGRQLDEDLEPVQTWATPFVDDECGGDCSFENHNTTDIPPHDCNNECNINNSHDDDSGEINCSDDCLDHSFSNSSISESVNVFPEDQSEENSTLIDNYQYGNCMDCSHAEHENAEKDSRIVDSETDTLSDFTAPASGQERFWGLLGFSGNGDGRQLDEDLEPVQTWATPFVDDECGGDCSFENHNTTDIPPHDCNNNECNINNSHEDDSGEINCSDDCLDPSFSNSSISESVNVVPEDQSEENSTIIDNYQYGNCMDCSHSKHENTEKVSDPKISSECDCGTDAKLSENYGDSTAEEKEKQCLVYCHEIFNFSNSKSETANYSFIETTEKHFQNKTRFPNFEICNCSSEASIRDSQTTENLAFDECDDCSFNVEIENYEKSEKVTSNDAELVHETVPSHSHQNIETDCNDCNYGSDRYDKELPNLKTDEHYILWTDKEFINQNISDLNALTKFNATESDLESNKSRQFLDSVFFAGSGDDELLGDELSINLVEGTLRPHSQISRGSRLNDDIQDEGNIAGISNISNKFYDRIAKQIIIPGRRGRLEDSESNMKESNTVQSGKVFPEETTFVRQIQFTSRRGRLEESSLDPSLNIPAKNNQTINTFIPIVRDTDDEKMTTDLFKENHGTNFTTELSRITSLLDVISSISEVPSTSFKPADSGPRFCTSASECNIELNEGCVKNSSSSVCGCRRQFVRNKRTGECVAKSTIKASIRLPAEEFDNDLTNQLSPRYKNMRTKASDMMLLLLGETPNLIPILAGLNVTEFSPGSLVVKWNIELAASNESEAELVKYVENCLKKALSNNTLIEKIPLDIRNASVLSVSSSLDPCKLLDMNYCSKDAFCIRNSAFPGGFTCRCKRDYFDASSSKKFPGEKCEALCPADYCGDHGYCEYFKTEGKICLCSGWYFGNRCEISGVVVVASFSANLFLIIAGIFIAIVCKQRCRKSSYVAPPGFSRSEEIGMSVRPRKVSDVIALEENIGANMSKFQQISTPAPPVIKVIKPTFNDSSLSFDCDSTFNLSPMAQDSITPTQSGQSVVVHGLSTI